MRCTATTATAAPSSTSASPPTDSPTISPMLVPPAVDDAFATVACCRAAVEVFGGAAAKQGQVSIGRRSERRDTVMVSNGAKVHGSRCPSGCTRLKQHSLHAARLVLSSCSVATTESVD